MADKHFIVKATRATITIGDIPLDVYQLPDGGYRLSGRGVTDAIRAEHKSLTRFYGVRSIQQIPFIAPTQSEGGQDSKKTPKRPPSKLSSDSAQNAPKVETQAGQQFQSGAEVERERINPGKEGSPFWSILIKESVDYWAGMAGNGNLTALALLQALAMESIERRADHAFGVQRTEQDRNDRIKARMSGKLTRINLQDAIATYLERHPESSGSYRKWIYKNATDRLIIELWGKNRKALASDRGVAPGGSLRDILESPELAAIERIEDLMGRLILQEDMDPLEAAKDAVKRTLTHHLFVR